MDDIRIGFGYDVHQLVKERPLILGGITIPHHKGLSGHSDADVLLHAIMDALLGAAAMGNIGMHFPDGDNSLEGISSVKLLEKVAEMLNNEGYTISNVDSTVSIQAPRIANYIPAMRQKIANTLQLGEGRVSVKATTTEQLGFVGLGKGVAAYAVALIRRTD